MDESIEEAESLLSKPNSPISHHQPSQSSIKSFLFSKTISILTKVALLFAVILLVYFSFDTYHSRFDQSSTSDSKVPQYFDPNPELWPGPTATGRAPFLAQETVIPSLRKGNKSIERLWGHLSPYHAIEDGWGLDEYPIPEGAGIVQVHTLHRHGSRYPTTGANVQEFGAKMALLKGQFNATGALSFLNGWTYGLGAEIMVPAGRLQLFESGINHYYFYGHLYEIGTKILVRSTTQKRMRESVWNFLSGFFGLDWIDRADVGYGIEGDALWNNSLAGYDNCPNSNRFQNMGGLNASEQWVDIYLQDAATRLNGLAQGLNLTAQDVYAMQTMCPYETAAYGHSPFCTIFTYTEWEGFEYSIDIQFAGGSSFQSPTGRAVGLAWLQEFKARLEHHTLPYSHSQANTSLDSSPTTFPVNQSLYFDFSHDTNIMSILTALGFTQFSAYLPVPPPPSFPARPQNLTVSHVTPFGARFDIEIIKSPHPLPNPDRSYHFQAQEGEVKYIRFKLNERTLPHPACGDRIDGFCALDELLNILRREEGKADFDFACFGDYEAVDYGVVGDGRPVGRG